MNPSTAPTESFDVIVVGGGHDKSQFVHEVDALGGVIGHLASNTTFHQHYSTNKTTAA